MMRGMRSAFQSAEEDVMANTTTPQQFVELENRYWRAIQEKDVAAAQRLTDDPCIVAGASGVAKVDAATFEKIMRGAKYTLDRFELKDAQVRLVGEDVALVAYKVHEELTVDGKPVVVEASDASTWVRRDGKWLCAMHTEALLGDPYGRDRKRAS
jgi:ketosteroid isomerase-like protein